MTKSTLAWEVKKFHELTTRQLHELLQLRVDVFVVEQQCAYPELDVYDRHKDTIHLSGRDDVAQLIAYARLLPPGLSYAEVSIGRFVVRNVARGQGVGHQLLQRALEESKKSWPWLCYENCRARISSEVLYTLWISAGVGCLSGPWCSSC